MRQTYQQPTLARLLLAMALICALLVTQFALTRHVLEHAASPIMQTVATASAVDDNARQPENSNVSCLTCLEHQAHGNALTSTPIVFVAQPIKTFERQALAPNTPYLAPERASQRAPPVLS